jgi:succinate dehydrogenase/fumarate reductase-like Fe-S protein
MSNTRIFEIYRYDPDDDAAPRMQRYELQLTERTDVVGCVDLFEET